MTRLRLRHALRTSLWLLPLVCLFFAIGLSFLMPRIDEAFGRNRLPRSLIGTPAGVQTLLSTIATGMVTLTTVVLTVMAVVVQLAMGQFSGRITHALMRDRPSQLAHGLFLGTFAYALLTIRHVDDKTEFVPALTVITAYLLMLASMVVLVLYVHHAGQAMRVSGIIDLVGDALRVELDRSYPDNPCWTPDDRIVPAREPGVLIEIDRGRIIATAKEADCVIELVPRMGDFVPVGAPLFRVHGGRGLSPSFLCGLVLLGSERTEDDDPPYGFRKLVDIAERAISEPFNDPTTAVQAIDRLHDCMRQLARRPFPTGRHLDADGRVRMIEPVLSWDGYVRLAFDELHLAAGGSPQVSRRLVAALVDLRGYVPAERRLAVDRQLDLLAAAAQRQLAHDEEIVAALTPDPQGIGSGRDVIADQD